MYSVINVDISAQPSDFLRKRIYYSSTFYRVMQYFHQPIIRGSSTVNGDSAHSNGKLDQEHNYVSFYVKSIEIKYDISLRGSLGPLGKVPGYIILFKLPYNDDEGIREKLIPTTDIKDIILYSHPENVLIYDIFNFTSGKSSDSRYLNYNKPFIVRPNDYVGVFYFFPDHNVIDNVYNIEATAKVIFKPQ